MEESLEKYYSGKICKLNEQEVNFRGEIHFNEYHEGIITIYDVTREVLKTLEYSNYNSAVMFLENKEYFSIFNFYVKQQIYSVDFDEDAPANDGVTLIIGSSKIINGKKYFSDDNVFDEMIMEITEGHELIGKCPYDFNTGYVNIKRHKDIHIPVQFESIHVETIMGNFEFRTLPKYQYSKDYFSIGFSHEIRFKPKEAISVRLFHEVLKQITSFFSLLCGESVTINKLSMHEFGNTKMDFNEFIGFCNFPKEKLKLLDSSGFDATSFKRIYIFKITDFYDLESAMNYWFEHYSRLYDTQNAYSRILMDEDLKILKIDKFLAAMQMIEGYTQAFGDEEKELEEFEKRKKEIISQLQDEADRKLVEERLGFSGIKFRKALKNYFYEGLNSLQEISKTTFVKKYDALIDKIYNDRNFYTHLSKHITPVLEFGEAMDIVSVCKELYRMILLSKMGLPQKLLKNRLAHNHITVALFNSIFGIKLEGDSMLSEFDKNMLHFTDDK